MLEEGCVKKKNKIKKKITKETVLLCLDDTVLLDDMVDD